MSTLPRKLMAHDVWNYLRETCCFRPTDWTRDQSVHARAREEVPVTATGSPLTAPR